MGQFWDVVKIAFALSVIWLIFRASFSATLFGDISAETMILFGGGVVAVIVVYLVKWRPIRNSVVKNKDDITYFRRAAIKYQASGRKFPGMISDQGFIEYPPGYDGMIIGDHVWMKWTDVTPDMGRVSKNLFYDIANDRIRGQITADDLHSRPAERIKQATKIIQLLKSGEVPTGVIMPETVERIIERDTKTQQEEREEGHQ